MFISMVQILIETTFVRKWNSISIFFPDFALFILFTIKYKNKVEYQKVFQYFPITFFILQHLPVLGR